MKLFLDGFRRESVEQEAKIGRLVSESSLPVPEVKEVVEVDDRYGIVFERLGSGRTMLQELASSPWRLGSLIRVFAQLHLEMHRHNFPELVSMRRKLAERIIRINDADFSSGARELVKKAKTFALARLEEFQEDDKLCHGDFHPDNIIMSPRGPVIIDWADAAKGSPAADVARTRLLLSLGTPVEGRMSRWLVKLGRNRALSLYLKSYLKHSPIQGNSIEAWQLPVALARLRASIPGEKDQLLTIIKSHLERPNK